VILWEKEKPEIKKIIDKQMKFIFIVAE